MGITLSVRQHAVRAARDVLLWFTKGPKRDIFTKTNKSEIVKLVVFGRHFKTAI